MPLAIFEDLGLETPLPTTIQQSIKRPVGILHDMLVKVDKFILLANFVILNCKVDAYMPIILGRSFLATGKTMVDVESGDLKLRLNDKEVVFNICKGLKLGDNLKVLSLMGQSAIT